MSLPHETKPTAQNLVIDSCRKCRSKAFVKQDNEIHCLNCGYPVYNHPPAPFVQEKSTKEFSEEYFEGEKTTSGFYNVSGAVGVLACSVRTVWTLIRECGITPIHSGHNTLLTWEHLRIMDNYRPGWYSVLCENGKVKVATSALEREWGLNRHTLNSWQAKGTVSGFVSGFSYLDLEALEERIEANLI